jgi:hypothetical protein
MDRLRIYVVGSAQPTVCFALSGNLGAPTLIVNSGIKSSADSGDDGRTGCDR